MSKLRQYGAVLSSVVVLAVIGNLLLAGVCCLPFRGADAAPAAADTDLAALLNPVPVCGPGAKSGSSEHPASGQGHVHCFVCPGTLAALRADTGKPFPVASQVDSGLAHPHVHLAAVENAAKYGSVSSRGPPITV